jgi:hypothetical protein
LGASASAGGDSRAKGEVNRDRKKVKMKRSVRIMLLAAAAVTCLCGHAYAGAKAVIGGAFAVPLLDAKTAVGKDGLLRLIFDFNPATGGTSTYSGSALWIIDPNGSLVAAGNATIPASVGTFYFTTKGGSIPIFPVERSNTAIFAQDDGNTTVLFYYGAGADPLLGVTSFGVWTFNSGGNLIAAATYGPFGGTRIFNLYFDSTGKIVVKWATTRGPSASYAGWVLDEFGSLKSATNFFGPFGPSNQIGKFRVNASNQLIWPFSLPAGGGNFTTVIWTFNSSGSALTNAQVYGPF